MPNQITSATGCSSIPSRRVDVLIYRFSDPLELRNLGRSSLKSMRKVYGVQHAEVRPAGELFEALADLFLRSCAHFLLPFEKVEEIKTFELTVFSVKDTSHRNLDPFTRDLIENYPDKFGSHFYPIV